MVYNRNTQDYWVFGLQLSSGILKKTQKDTTFLETKADSQKIVSQYEIIHLILCIVFRVFVLLANFVA
jgi:hypothetical protein